MVKMSKDDHIKIIMKQINFLVVFYHLDLVLVVMAKDKEDIVVILMNDIFEDGSKDQKEDFENVYQDLAVG